MWVGFFFKLKKPKFSLVLDANLKFSLRVPDDQVSVVARCQAALLLAKAAQPSRVLAQEAHRVPELKALLTGRGPEQRQA